MKLQQINYRYEGGVPNVTFYPSQGLACVVLHSRIVDVYGVPAHSDKLAAKCVEIARAAEEKADEGTPPRFSVEYES